MHDSEKKARVDLLLEGKSCAFAGASDVGRHNQTTQIQEPIGE
jgi:hypothetical protein